MNTPQSTSSPSMNNGRSSGLVLGLVLGFLALLMSLLPIGLPMLATSNANRVVSSALSQPIWEMKLGFNIAVFLLTLLAVHLLFGLSCWLMAVLSQIAWPKVAATGRQWTTLWFLPASLWVLIANADLFPNSLLGFPYHETVSRKIAGVSPFVLFSLLMGGAIATTLVAAVLRMPRLPRLALPIAGLSAIVVATAIVRHEPAAATASADHPNVILLGVDSLRPDAVTVEHTPSIHRMLAGSVQFTDAMTPLARTFPSWVSILSGRAPQTTGAVMNLLPRDQIHTGESLPTLLKARGYHTAYAIDESRFSNVDESYGFDQAVMPITGASDFVVGTYSDTPLSNLVVNSPLGGLLFPFLHANRAVDVTYEPDTFTHELSRELQFGQPLFLALHLTLPHWPYTWIDSETTGGKDPATAAGRYRASLRRVDRQFADILSLLQERGALDNALVVILSDHGQALNVDADALVDYLPSGASGVRTMHRSGHGTSVLSPPQYQTVLGLRAFGAAGKLLPAPQALDVPASMLDIAPTILDLLGIASPQPFDGVSLAPAIRGGAAAMPQLADRIRFTETEYSPRNFSLKDPMGPGAAEAAQAYRVDPATDRVSVRTEWLPQILKNRQYAAVLGNRALAAAMPDVRKDGQRQLILVPKPFARAGDIDAGGRGSVSAADRARLLQALQDQFAVKVSDAPEAVAPGS